VKTMIQIVDNTGQSPQLRSRIYNWKFVQATQYLNGQPEDVKDLVHALASTYGDPGMLEKDDDKNELLEEGMTRDDVIMVAAVVSMLLGQ